MVRITLVNESLRGKRLKDNNSVFGTHIFSPKGFFWWHYKFTLYSLPTKYLFRNYWSSVNKQITTIPMIYKPFLQRQKWELVQWQSNACNWYIHQLMGYHLIKYTYLDSRKLFSFLGKLIEATIPCMTETNPLQCTKKEQMQH